MVNDLMPIELPLNYNAVDGLKHSIEKSDQTNRSYQGLSKPPKNALQQDNDYFDSNQVGNEEQVTIQPE